MMEMILGDMAKITKLKKSSNFIPSFSSCFSFLSFSFFVVVYIIMISLCVRTYVRTYVPCECRETHDRHTQENRVLVHYSSGQCKQCYVVCTTLVFIVIFIIIIIIIIVIITVVVVV
jgi:hypothetical protein